ncbi:MAG: tRNA preQ1(34) S-adenosylmethionine ribosyltransferase-isomerase QueA [Chloroflexi bacterium]|nr:tRNA preQ1(34) S-adenosylmethionine ribosyltransferase-isomerase QueA [Chloroflexota bacterium]
MPQSEVDPDLRLSAYDYPLPKELIAQQPASPRDSARLFRLERATRAMGHHHVHDLPDLLTPGDLLVVNRSRVLQSRLNATKIPSGGKVELTLLRPGLGDAWEALARGHRLAAGQRLTIGEVAAEVGESIPGGARLIHFSGVDVQELLVRQGQTPLPPYIHGYAGDPERYQTVYANALGSAAAPTAGLHFTPELITTLRDRGIGWATVTLHIGLDTFRPITDENVRQRHIHTEWVEVPEEAVAAVRTAKERGGRVIAVGTSAVRALEFAGRDGELAPYRGPVDLFVVPGHRFRIVDAMLTNFHMPRTSVLLLVAAFAGRELILRAYQEAIEQSYRMLSFGDAMLIV